MWTHQLRWPAQTTSWLNYVQQRLWRKWGKDFWKKNLIKFAPSSHSLIMLLVIAMVRLSEKKLCLNLKYISLLLSDEHYENGSEGLCDIHNAYPTNPRPDKHWVTNIMKIGVKVCATYIMLTPPTPAPTNNVWRLKFEVQRFCYYQ